MKAVEKVVTKEDGERLQKCVAGLESENCKLKAAAAEASKDYEVLYLGNSSLLAKRNDIHY
jgi:hypothetical protein